MSLLYVGDIGAELVISTSNTGIPVTATLTIRLEKPGGTTVELAVTPAMIDYSTGVITYPTVDGDLNESGEYRIQVHGSFVDGTDSVSDIDTFNVYDKIEV